MAELARGEKSCTQSLNQSINQSLTQFIRCPGNRSLRFGKAHKTYCASTVQRYCARFCTAFVFVLREKFLSFGFGFGFDFSRWRRSSFVLPRASTCFRHFVVATRRQLFVAVLLLPAASVRVPVPVLGPTVRWRRRGESGVDAVSPTQRGGSTSHRPHCSGQLPRALPVQRSHVTDNKSILLLFAHHQVPAPVTCSFPAQLSSVRLLFIGLN